MKTKNFFSLLLLLASLSLQAQIPNTLSYQGELRDSQGMAVEDGDYTMFFALYDDSNSGNELWSEEQLVQVSNGLFSVLLGSTNNLDLPFDRPYWLEITIDGETLSPRTALTASPYSMSGVATSLNLNPGQNITITNENGEVTHALNNDGSSSHSGLAEFGNGLLIPSTDTAIYFVPLSSGMYIGPDANPGFNSENNEEEKSLLPVSLNVTSLKAEISNKTAVTGISESGSGIFGRSTSETGVVGRSYNAYGVWGLSDGTDGRGVRGEAEKSIGVEGIGLEVLGVKGLSFLGTGVLGESTSGPGTHGKSHSKEGIRGESMNNTGVFGFTQSSSFAGVTGQNEAGGPGVFGNGTTGYGVSGSSSSAAGVRGLSQSSYGVHGISPKSDGVFGESSSADHAGVHGSNAIGNGVYGFSSTENKSGVYGKNDQGYGVFGSSTSGVGVQGMSTSKAGVFGSTSSDMFAGVEGANSIGAGLKGFSGNGIGLVAYGGYLAAELQGDVTIINNGKLMIDNVPEENSDNILVWGSDKFVKKRALSDLIGEEFTGTLVGYDFILQDTQGTTVFDVTTEGNSSQMGLATFNDDVVLMGTDGKGIKWVDTDGTTNAGFGRKDLDSGNIMSVYGRQIGPNDWAGVFDGNVDINGVLCAEDVKIENLCVNNSLLIKDDLGNIVLDIDPNADPDTEYAIIFDGNLMINGALEALFKNFLIDHPLDPENKILRHFSIESDELKNSYDGNVSLNENGEATVSLPDWFEALNRDFRYQLTCVGGFANVYIAEKVENNSFKIAGGYEGLEVSWQVTGVRHDKQAMEHLPPIEDYKK